MLMPKSFKPYKSTLSNDENFLNFILFKFNSHVCLNLVSLIVKHE